MTHTYNEKRREQGMHCRKQTSEDMGLDVMVILGTQALPPLAKSNHKNLSARNTAHLIYDTGKANSNEIS